MPLQIIHQDITKIRCDAIVNPTDGLYTGSGGTDLAVHTAAGKELDLVCEYLPTLKVGDVGVTSGYRLPCKYIIHTVGPIWEDGRHNEENLLRACYINSLVQARKLDAERIAMPLISAGTFGFPKDKVLKIAIGAISDFLALTEAEMEVLLCVFDRQAYEISEKLDLEDFLRSRLRDAEPPQATMSAAFSTASFNLAEKCEAAPREKPFAKPKEKPAPMPMEDAMPPMPAAMPEPDTMPKPGAVYEAMPKPMMAEEQECCFSIEDTELADWLKMHDETFAVTLLKLIDINGMTDTQCYKKANVSRQTFWKICNEPQYRPGKPTVLAFAIALKLDYNETQQLLKTAGFSLSHSNRFDLIIEYYIRKGIYDIFEINAALYKYDQVCLG